MGLSERRLVAIGQMIAEEPSEGRWGVAARELYEELVRIRPLVLERGSVFVMGKDPKPAVRWLLIALSQETGKRRGVTPTVEPLPIQWAIKPASSLREHRVSLRVTAYDQANPRLNAEGSVEEVVAQFRECKNCSL